tara:strand:- start:445 stop:2241 length:1797 start_codon:yes stop_codon:yes gene_type:complete
MEHNDNEPEFCLNLELAQCRSKTDKTLNHIAIAHHQTNYNIETTKTKLISIIFTNNSLLETAAWNSRSTIKFNLANNNIIIRILSSESNSCFKNEVDLQHNFIYKYVNKGKINDFGDVLLMCNHPKRIEDICEFIKHINELKKHIFDKSGYNIKFNIFFDEYDQSTLYSQFKNFVKHIYKENLKHMVKSFIMISATPACTEYQELKNITGNNNLIIKNLSADDRLTDSEDYKTILKQKHIPFEGPKSPCDYLNEIHRQNKEDKEKWDKKTDEEKGYDTPYEEIFQEGKVYFVPAQTRCNSHEDIAGHRIWKELGIWVLILNGKNKEFRSPKGITKKIDLTKKKLDGKRRELRDEILDWKKDNPTAGLVITGHNVICRGLTFLTKDDETSFCFDYMIISSYQTKSINELIQLVGRGQGKSEYIAKQFSIICPQDVWDLIKNYIDNCERIINSNPEVFDEYTLSNIGVQKKNKSKKTTHQQITRTSIDDLATWIKNNLKVTIQKDHWKGKLNGDGFYTHRYRGIEQIWSEEDALKEAEGGMGQNKRQGHRVFPCYKNVNDKNSLLWYVFYKKDIKVPQNNLENARDSQPDLPMVDKADNS